MIAEITNKEKLGKCMVEHRLKISHVHRPRSDQSINGIAMAFKQVFLKPNAFEKDDFLQSQLTTKFQIKFQNGGMRLAARQGGQTK